MSRKKHKVRPPESHGCFARCDLHSRRHASPVLAVTGNPGTSPRWQPHYSDNSAGWKSFRYVPRDAAMCSVPRDACETFNSRRCRAVRYISTACDLQATERAEETVTTATNHSSRGSWAPVVYHYVADAYLIRPALRCLTPREQTGRVVLCVHTKITCRARLRHWGEIRRIRFNVQCNL